MMAGKKTVTILLLLAMALALAGCGQGSGTQGDAQSGQKSGESAAPADDFKVGIVTGTVSQCEDEYRAAEVMKKRYGDRIVHVTYPDNFMQEQETTISRIAGIAADPKVKAIIVLQAVPGTAAAIDKIRETRKDILFTAGVTHEDPAMIRSKADLVLERDEPQRGRTIIELAKKMGATKFLHYSFPRHMSQELISKRRDIMEQECKKAGIEFLQVTAPDPMGPDGIPGTQKFILEDIPLQVKTHGKDICVFGTNLSMMEPMIRAALDSGAIFAEQCSPGPTMGYPGALGIDVKGMSGNMAAIMDAVEKKIIEKGGAGRFATWPVSLNMVLIQAAAELSFQAVEGKAKLLDMAALKAALEKEGGAGFEVRVEGEKNNHFFVIAPSRIFGQK
ncbi:MAG: DUF3798 domain-containing protein [Bacillota bacterium]